MRILIDTNIIIYREESMVASRIAELFRIAAAAKIKIIVHPLSRNELLQYKDEQVREENLSKYRAYSELESPPDPYLLDDEKYLDIVDKERTDVGNDKIDNIILYAVYKNAVSLLVTNDKRLINKAHRISQDLDVFGIDETIQYIKAYYPTDKTVPIHPGIKKDKMFNINLNDSLFDKLKIDYGAEFEKWFAGKSREGTDCYVSYIPETNVLGSFMVLKIEDNDKIHCTPALPSKKFVKISTLIVTNNGFKIGEALISIAISFALENNIDALYLTHFTEQPNDKLVSLLEKYGFEKHGVSQKEYSKGYEDVYLKHLKPPYSTMPPSQNPSDEDIKYFPSFYIGSDVNKFIVPIRPKYHDKLFPLAEQRQTTIWEFDKSHGGLFNPESYAILKAYLSNSNTRKISKGDILLFYKSGDSLLTEIGVVDRVEYDLSDNNIITELIQKRTVYSQEEIFEFSKPLTVLLFRHHATMKRKISLSELKKGGVLSAPPQSINQISDENIRKLINLGGFDASLAFY